MTIVLLDKTTQDADYTFTHSSPKELRIRGPKRRVDPLDPADYAGLLNRGIRSVAGAGLLNLVDVTIQIGDTDNNDNPISKISWTMILGSSLKLNNSTIKGRSTRRIYGTYNERNRYFIPYLQLPLKSTITFDVKSTGTVFDTRRGSTDFRIAGKVVFQTQGRALSDALEADSVDANELVFKLSRQVKERPVVVEFWNANMRLLRNRDNVINHKLKWVFDFPGTLAESFRLVGPLKNGFYVAGQSTATLERSKFSCEFKSIGNIKNAEIFSCRNFFTQMKLGELTDTSITASGDSRTISGIIADALNQKINDKSKIGVPVADNKYHPNASSYRSLLPLNNGVPIPNVYNSDWYAPTGNNIPNPRTVPFTTLEEELRYGGDVQEDIYKDEEDFDPL